MFQFVGAQNYADKEFYLVDSLDLKTLNTNDSTLIDTALTNYYATDNDTLRITIILDLISKCENDIWVKYNDFLKSEVQEKINQGFTDKVLEVFYNEHLSFTYNNLGYYYFNLNKRQKAINSFTEAIRISKKINKKEVIPTALNNIGYLYKLEGNILKALDYYHQSLKLYREIGKEKNISLSLNNIGGIYFSQKEYDKSLKYFREALIIEKREGTKKGEARIYGNIGSIYIEQNRIQNAIEYLNYSVKKYSEIEYEKGMANSLSKLAMIELEALDSREDNREELLKILAKQQRVLRIYKKHKKDKEIADILNDMSQTYRALGDKKNALKNARTSLDIAQKFGFAQATMGAAKTLKNIYKEDRDFVNGFKMQELFYVMQDSLGNKSIKEATIQKQYQYQYEKQHFSDSLDVVKMRALKEVEYQQSIEKQKTFTIVGLVGVLLMIVVALVIFRGLQQKKKSNIILAEKNSQIEEKNLEITDSISYAKRIQDSILPSESTFEKSLKGFFVFYQPKDIVAGDFYWIKQVDDTVLFAAADCTGHGVPGALVSVVCNNALNSVVKEQHLVQPAEILTASSKIISNAFKSDKKGLKIRDGMDIALCAINYKTNTLHFSGANNPLYIVRKGELIEIKGDKKSIGGRSDFNYTNHTVDIEKEDMIYVFSDGYADQFGGVKGKKFMYKQFKNLLVSIAEMSAEAQNNKIKKAFFNWKGDTFQVDDICVIGVRV